MSTEVIGPRARAIQISIPDASNTTGEIDIGDGRILSTIHIPSGFEGGYIEFDVAPAPAAQNGVYQPLKDTSGDAIRYTAASSTTIKVDPQQFLGIQFFKIRSVDSGGTTANQSGEASLMLVSV